jgi:hypothetical protein
MERLKEMRCIIDAIRLCIARLLCTFLKSSCPERHRVHYAKQCSGPFEVLVCFDYDAILMLLKFSCI